MLSFRSYVIQRAEQLQISVIIYVQQEEVRSWRMIFPT